jgi:SAM-dependent methyltransferase
MNAVDSGMRATPQLPGESGSIADFLAWWLDHPVLTPRLQAVFDSYYAGYKRSFGSYIRMHYSAQSHEVESLIRTSSKPRLLEIGAGCGTEAIWFALRGAQVTSIDIQAERLEVAKARQSLVEQSIGRKLDLQFQLCSLFDHVPDEPYDVIWMEQAFHHIEPRPQAYVVVASLLAPGGHVVVSEANAWNPLIQLMLFKRRGFRTVVHKTGADGAEILYGNERVVPPVVLRRGFCRVGVEPVSTRYFRFLPNIPIASTLAFLEKWVPSSAVPLFTHYNYVGRKTPAAGSQP